MVMPRMNWIAAVLSAAFSLIASFTLAAEPSPIGNWQVTTGQARFAVSSCDGGLCAELIWLRSDVRTSKNLAYMNRYIVRGGQPKGPGQWAGNIVFEGKTYKSTMKLVSAKLMTLRGCAGILCRTYKLNRI
jgi:uncharacterized protein (DUF2147 family)